MWATLNDDEDFDPHDTIFPSHIECVVYGSNIRQGHNYGGKFILRIRKKNNLRSKKIVMKFYFRMIDFKQAADLARIQLPSNTDSAETIDLLSQWIRSCDESHILCTSEGSIKKLPTRLIDVRVRASDTVKLCYSKDIEPQNEVKYVTLSHSWGKLEFLTLTNQNMDDFLAQIPVLELRKTFQDAISLTRVLGVRYLWIDSLCIIQGENSEEDWRHESATMCAVYSNAWCNIAADRAIDELAGLFSIRDVSRIQPQAVCLRNSKNDAFYEFVTRHWDRSWSSQIDESHLAQRAWVMQERFLAKRVIHFTENQIFFECRESEVCEVYPQGLPGDYIFGSGLTSRQFDLYNKPVFSQLQQWREESSIAKRQRPENLKIRGSLFITIQTAVESGTMKQSAGTLMVWRSFVEKYSMCELSHERDKLIALSGLAREFQRIFNCEYVAGLWANEYFWKQLVWRACTIQDRPHIYIAPSWSWASVTGSVDYYNSILDVEPMCEMLDYRLETVDGDGMSLVVSGFLQLTGHIIPVHSTNLSNASSRWKTILPCQKHNMREVHDCVPNIVHFYQDGIEELDDIVYIIPIQYTNDNVWSLVLQSCAGRGHGFQRIGILQGKKLLLKEYYMAKHSMEGSELISKGLHDEYNEERNKYTITIY